MESKQAAYAASNRCQFYSPHPFLLPFFLVLTRAACRCFKAAMPPTLEEASRRPNILCFLFDDYDGVNMSVYPGGLAAGSQPNLERVAREGLVFDRAFT